MKITKDLVQTRKLQVVLKSFLLIETQLSYLEVKVSGFKLAVLLLMLRKKRELSLIISLNLKTMSSLIS